MKKETVEEFLARGGTISRVDDRNAKGSGNGRSSKQIKTSMAEKRKKFEAKPVETPKNPLESRDAVFVTSRSGAKYRDPEYERLVRLGRSRRKKNL
ncbi:MAG: hypothetical protein NDI61_01945 [Bdellovibrionaceae bacterium]|nr:hypothetical protein [Pseudobdellovibrionaceae bacterium]